MDRIQVSGSRIYHRLDFRPCIGDIKRAGHTAVQAAWIGIDLIKEQYCLICQCYGKLAEFMHNFGFDILKFNQGASEK